MKVVLANVVVRTHDAALEQAEKTFELSASGFYGYTTRSIPEHVRSPECKHIRSRHTFARSSGLSASRRDLSVNKRVGRF
jgi:hypothetical protein